MSVIKYEEAKEKGEGSLENASGKSSNFIPGMIIGAIIATVILSAL